MAAGKIFVVSLPRTGTKSLCEMLEILGFKVSHDPISKFEKQFESFDVFADTPVYCPSVYSKLLTKKSHKFIYIDRNVDDWVRSFERTKYSTMYSNYRNTNSKFLNADQKINKSSLCELFDDKDYSRSFAIAQFYKHKTHMFKTIPSSQLLIYRFEYRWKALCDFVNKPVPRKDIPKIKHFGKL